MIEFTRGLSTLRVWLDELPDRRYPVATVSEQSIQVESLAGHGTQSAAVELRLARGPHNPYGLLGGTFTPDGSCGLLLQVASSAEEIPVDWRTSPTIGNVQCGLPSEYVDNIVQGAMNTLGKTSLASGVLRLDCAAHSFVDSSSMIFGWLAGAVVRLLSLSNTSMADEDVQAILVKHGPPFLWW